MRSISLLRRDGSSERRVLCLASRQVLCKCLKLEAEARRSLFNDKQSSWTLSQEKHSSWMLSHGRRSEREAHHTSPGCSSDLDWSCASPNRQNPIEAILISASLASCTVQGWAHSSSEDLAHKLCTIAPQPSVLARGQQCSTRCVCRGSIIARQTGTCMIDAGMRRCSPHLNGSASGGAPRVNEPRGPNLAMPQQVKLQSLGRD